MEVRREHLQIARRTFVLLFWEEVSLLFGSFFLLFGEEEWLCGCRNCHFLGGNNPRQPREKTGKIINSSALTYLFPLPPSLQWPFAREPFANCSRHQKPSVPCTGLCLGPRADTVNQASTHLQKHPLLFGI